MDLKGKCKPTCWWWPLRSHVRSPCGSHPPAKEPCVCRLSHAQFFSDSERCCSPEMEKEMILWFFLVVAVFVPSCRLSLTQLFVLNYPCLQVCRKPLVSTCHNYGTQPQTVWICQAERGGTSCSYNDTKIKKQIATLVQILPLCEGLWLQWQRPLAQVSSPWKTTTN